MTSCYDVTNTSDIGLMCTVPGVGSQKPLTPETCEELPTRIMKSNTRMMCKEMLVGEEQALSEPLPG